MAKVDVSEEQVLLFRARRGHLAGPGARTVSEAARSIIGAQSQQLEPSLLALSIRTAGRPTAAAIRSEIFGDKRTLVRTWGQRDTIHVYDARAHWRRVRHRGPYRRTRFRQERPLRQATYALPTIPRWGFDTEASS